MRYVYLLFTSLILFTSCREEAKPDLIPDTIPDGNVVDNIKINQLQYLGSHNSYHLDPDPEIFEAMQNFQAVIPYNVDELDYRHESLEKQFTEFGIRQIELDLYGDINGGRYYNRVGYNLVSQPVESNIEALQAPGTKVLHLPDVDFNTHHISFIDALESIQSWSTKFPEHLPIFILLEMKASSLADNPILANLGYTATEPWDEAHLSIVDSEIRSIFDEDDIITPADIKGNYNSVNEAVLAHNWPTVGESRGKVMFIFISEEVSDTYAQIHPSTDSRVIFVNTTPGNPESAYLSYDIPFNTELNLRAEQGYLIRTRVDAGTYEAREGDYSRWSQALLSGAHFLSTDYYLPDYRAETSNEWSSYHVNFENGSYRTNPITSP